MFVCTQSILQSLEAKPKKKLARNFRHYSNRPGCLRQTSSRDAKLDEHFTWYKEVPDETSLM